MLLLSLLHLLHHSRTVTRDRRGLPQHHIHHTRQHKHPNRQIKSQCILTRYRIDDASTYAPSAEPI